jgi:hypothetical protein
VSKDYSDLDPAILKPSLSDGTDLKPSITTDSYSGGTPSAPGDLKPSVLYPDGRIKEGLLYLGELAPSILRVGAAISATITYLSRLMTSSTTTPFYAGTTNIVDSSSTGDYREIQPGRCLDFDGSTQYITVGDIAANVIQFRFGLMPEDITLDQTDGRAAIGKREDGNNCTTATVTFHGGQRRYSR